MSNAADGYLGDWLPHRSNCRCTDCQLDRAQSNGLVLQKRIEEALAELDGYVDINDSGGPNLAMKITMILRGEPR